MHMHVQVHTIHLPAKYKPQIQDNDLSSGHVCACIASTMCRIMHACACLNVPDLSAIHKLAKSLQANM